MEMEMTPIGSHMNQQVQSMPKKEPDKHSECNYLICYLRVAILFLINLLNHMDRLIIAGILNETSYYFDIDDTLSGLIQTAFFVGFILSAPIFGYLGDRFPRKYIIVFGVTFWSIMTLLGSFASADQFVLFLITRSLVGVGEAAFSCVATTIIGDMFQGTIRTRMISIFYFALPIGIGLSYTISSNISMYFENWRWALRITPPIGFCCVILLALFVEEPQRGGNEGLINCDYDDSSLVADLIYLLKKKTFIFITIGFTFASFALGGLSFWAPVYVIDAIESLNQKPEQIPLTFGVIFCISGIIALNISFFLAPKLRSVIPNSEPLICAFGSLISVPTLSIAIMMTNSYSSHILFWFNICIAISSLCLSWTMFSDILVNVIHPNKRSTAFAFSIIISHLFGDAGSPYLVGIISDFLKEDKTNTPAIRFNSLQVALYLAPFIASLSSIAYFIASFYIISDKKKLTEN